MQITAIPFSTTDWSTIEPTIHEGISGEALWRTVYLNDVRIRLVDYSRGYEADHWCIKGHIIYCVEGEMTTELKDGRKISISKGLMYTVGDDCEPHRSSTIHGCKLFIVD